MWRGMWYCMEGNSSVDYYIGVEAHACIICRVHLTFTLNL